MILPLNALTQAQVSALLARIISLPQLDGRITAGAIAREVKHNTQLDSAHPGTRAVIAELLGSLQANGVLMLAARPQRWSAPLINCYQNGGEYGWHTDDSEIMGVRTDLSYTLFLNDPASYDGGELTLRDTAGEQAFKLAAGSLLLYPGSTIHCVTPVTRGVRFAAVGWIESRVRDGELRACLFEIGRIRAQLHAQDARDTALTLAQVEGALLRRFG